MLYFFCHLLLFISLIDVCFSLNCISVNGLCLTCSSTHYEKFFLNNLRLSASNNNQLSEQDCLIKKSDINKRNIIILNKVCQNCSNFDKTYPNLINAFEEESKFAVQYKNILL